MLNEYEYGFMEAMDGLRVRYEELEKYIKGFPLGCISVRKKKGRTYYYHVTSVNGNRIQKYISADSENEFIRRLLFKRDFAESFLKESKYIKKILSESLPYMKSLTEKMSCSSPISFQVYPSEKQAYVSELIYTAKHGEKVRSKSEVFICDALYSLNIKYAYERRLLCCGQDFCPDFTLVHPLSGKVVYLEHLGLDDERYKKTWKYKKEKYEEHNLSEGRDLFITTEADIPDIKNVLARLFTVKKYEALMNLASSFG